MSDTILTREFLIHSGFKQTNPYWFVLETENIHMQISLNGECHLLEGKFNMVQVHRLVNTVEILQEVVYALTGNRL